MIEFGGISYYIDMNALDKAITPVGASPTDIITQIDTKTTVSQNNEILGKEIIETHRERGKEIDGARYDIVRMMIETMIDYKDDIDDTLGIERGLGKTPLSYQLAFNTLLKCGVLKEIK